MKFEQIKEILVAAAAREGIKIYEIYAMNDRSMSTETLKDEISAFSYGVSGGVSFRCIVDGKMGYASGELMTEEALSSLVTQAAENARCIENDDVVEIFAGSAQYDEVKTGDFTLPEAAQLKDWALRLQRETYAQDAMVSDGTQSTALAYESEIDLYNSRGLSLHNRVGISGAGVYAVVKASEDDAEMDGKIIPGSSYEDFAAVPAEVVKDAKARLGAAVMDSGRYDCILCAQQVRALLSVFSAVFSAKQVQMGLSLLGGKMGEKIASDCLNITDDPRDPHCPVQTSFDGEGVATYQKPMIEGGVLKNYLYDLTTAKKDGVTSTGNGQRGSYASPVSIAPYCFRVEAGKMSREDMMAAIGDGIMITELKGLHAGANAVSGDFSIESAGFRIRDGKRAEAIKTFTIAGNFFELLKTIDGVGDRVDYGFPGGFTVFAAPDLLLRGVSVAGK
ncbi:MAG: TldD/PmbA family protein [Clostridia bacterium]|nr:TldD/PmbA family protein [Clostridia bacterium]